VELIRALRLDQEPEPARIAFVGAGGKTTAIFQCARQLLGSVLLTATTHLAVSQLDMADRHYVVDHVLLDQLEKDFLPGIILLTGPVDRSTNRTQGVSGDLLERIHILAESHQVPLLIEADGSRKLPVKAPASHEPPIPTFVDKVVVVAGLTALGKPLTSQWAHRSEIFASLSGLKPGELITPASLSHLLVHPLGGLKNIPSRACRIALLNQADTPELQAQATSLISTLLHAYDATIISSLAPKHPVCNYHSPIHAVHQSISAVVLAAGEARRFGNPKQLLTWHGKPLVWHVANKAFQAGLSPVVVVCGAQMDAIKNALADLPVVWVHNPDWQQGQGTSVKLGTQAVGTRSGGILFLLADQPQIPIPLIRSLIDAHAQNLNPITGPMIDGQRANPVLFDQFTFKDLLSLSGDAGGRKLFPKYGVDWIPWHDPSPLFDVDTPEDYARLMEMDPC